MSIAAFAGSAEFVVASMFVEPFNPLATLISIFAGTALFTALFTALVNLVFV